MWGVALLYISSGLSLSLPPTPMPAGGERGNRGIRGSTQISSLAGAMRLQMVSGGENVLTTTLAAGTVGASSGLLHGLSIREAWRALCGRKQGVPAAMLER